MMAEAESEWRGARFGAEVKRREIGYRGPALEAFQVSSLRAEVEVRVSESGRETGGWA
jgi:hypothetical protein